MNSLVRRELKVSGLTCTHCENRITSALKKLDGVQDVHVSYTDNRVTINYDSERVATKTLIETIEKLDYKVIQESNKETEGIAANQLIGIGVIIVALYLIINSLGGFNFIPKVDKSIGYGMLFVVGLLTSLHCIAMCGGINLTQCVIQSTKADAEKSHTAKLLPSLLYNSGRVISYTIIGGIVGALGSALSFSTAGKAVVTVLAGLFMVIMGINMLNIFPWLRRFNIRMPRIFGDKIASGTGRRGPFIVGLLNGLMPCGPLQTMQLYALGTGSFLAGATSMFLFSLGTVPLMFGFGALSSFLSGQFNRKMLKVSAVLVIVLGIFMVNRGLSLSGISIAAPLNKPTSGNVATIRGNVQEVVTTMEGGKYKPFVVQQGIPVRWTVRVKPEDLNGCNNPLTVPKYNIKKKLVPGDNLIEFTPKEAGTITYTCWMGMVSSTITVVPDVAKLDGQGKNYKDDQSGSNPSTNSQSKPGCCFSGGNTGSGGGKIPADDLYVVKGVNGVQIVVIKVNDQGYSPAAIVVQKGTKIKLRFVPEKLNSCNETVVFPEYQGQLNLSAGQLITPELTAKQDFSFQCWMGMLHGYVKVVDDVNIIDIPAIKKELDNITVVSGGGCCGG